MLKRIVCLFLSLAVMATMSFSLSVSAATSNVNDFEWYYENGCAIISGYYGTASDVVIPSKVGSSNTPVTEIGSWAFEDNTTIKSVTLPDTMTTIGDYAFWGCTNLTHITVPDSVTKVGMSAFYDTNLQNLREDKDFKYIGKVAYSYKGDYNYADIVFPEGTVGIAAGMFYVSKYVGPKSVVIPDSVKAIGEWAFKNCSVLESVTMGCGIEYIGEDAFDTYSDVTMYCYEGTNALGYAKVNGFDYVVLEKPAEPIDKYIIGDSNDDGVVDIFDATHLQMYIASLVGEDEVHLSASDVDDDSDISIMDATAIQFYLASFDIDYPIGDVVEVYPTETENRVRFDDFSLVLPEGWTYMFYYGDVFLCERANHEAGYDGTLITILKFDEKPDYNWGFTYLGTNGGSYYYSFLPTSVTYDPTNAYLREKYEAAKKEVSTTMDTFRFEDSTDGRTYFGDFSLDLPANLTYEGDEEEICFYSKYCYDNNVSGIGRGYVYSIVKTTASPSDFFESTKLLGEKNGYNYIRLFPTGFGYSSDSKANAERDKALHQEAEVTSSFKFIKQ
ncbi:MAG: leucine-rich repeat domain-containing protein [Ruminococcus sp.]|nr:leucine-rich repeat domain-containing protein [Ruminococcus sp.]